MVFPEKQTQETLLEVSKEDVRTRLDLWLRNYFPETISRNRIQDMIQKGFVRVNGVPLIQKRHTLKEGDLISILHIPDESIEKPQPEKIPLEILFEDDDLMVVNKPAGLVVHPGAGNQTGTMLHALLDYLGENLSCVNGEQRRGILHRLDKNTSGAILIAKNDNAHKILARSFSNPAPENRIERIYSALVWGSITPERGKIDAPLGRSTNRTKRAVVPKEKKDSRHAVTHFKVMKKFSFEKTEGEKAYASLMECRLETGRTHQIRVHMAHIHHPIIGDDEYGKRFHYRFQKLPDPLEFLLSGCLRQMLHAQFLTFEHPSTGQRVSFEAPLPDDMSNILSILEKYRSD